VSHAVRRGAKSEHMATYAERCSLPKMPEPIAHQTPSWWRPSVLSVETGCPGAVGNGPLGISILSPGASSGSHFHAMSRQTTNASIASPRPFHPRPVRSAARSSSADSALKRAASIESSGVPYGSLVK
jgi:hypothetical protein